MLPCNGCSEALVDGMKDTCNGLVDAAFSGTLGIALLSDLNYTAEGTPLLSSTNEPSLSARQNSLTCLICCCLIHLLFCSCVGPLELHCAMPAVNSSYSTFCTIIEMISLHTALTQG